MAARATLPAVTVTTSAGAARARTLRGIITALFAPPVFRRRCAFGRRALLGLRRRRVLRGLGHDGLQGVGAEQSAAVATSATTLPVEHKAQVTHCDRIDIQVLVPLCEALDGRI